MYPYRDLTITTPEFNITFIPHSDVNDTKRNLKVGKAAMDIQVHTCSYEITIRHLVKHVHDFNGIKWNSLKFQYFCSGEEVDITNTAGVVANNAHSTGSYALVHLRDFDNRRTIIITYTKMDYANDDDNK
ncbi:hypothetical protein LPJ71_007263, partial [Coemansia sp. S17]